jgi:hypothetical protein
MSLQGAWRMQVLFAAALVLAATSNAADPRPDYKEWKEKKAAEKDKADAAAADQSKMAAVDKVIVLLQDLRGKVLAEGEAEAKSYNKFACFCKDGQTEKETAIKEGEDAQESLTADINKLADGRKEDDKKIEELEKEIKDLEKDVKKAEKTNADEIKTYTEEEADLSKAIDGIESAIKVLKASKPAALLLQMRSVSEAVRSALAMADALGLGVDTLQGSAASLLQQAPEVEVENYKFHSSSVIETLEKLHKKFREKKAESDADEVKRLQKHDMLMQEKADTLKAKNLEVSQTQKARDDKIAEIAEKSQELTTVSAQLLDDRSYLSELYSMCKGKAKTWDQRSKVRADELSAITAATEILKTTVSEKTSAATLRFAQMGVSVKLAKAVARSEDAMDAIEADAEEEENHDRPANFLQRRAVSRHQDPKEAGKEAVIKLLRAKGSQLSSTLLTSLASQITKDPFEKVKTLIEELLKRLKAESAAEATQKGWCDKSMSEANQKKTDAAQAIDELNDSMAKLEALRALLKSDLAKLKDEIEELEEAQKEADEVRKEEKAENKATVKSAEEGKEAIEKAIDILDKFYKGAAKEKVSLVQAHGPKDDAPDAGFKNDEAYKGAQSGAEGVMGMLEVILGDFDRTIKETKKAEDEAEQDHKSFTAETKASLKSKEETEKAKKKEKSDADDSFDKDKESLKKKTDLMVTTIEELMELKKACVDTGMSYEERVERREDEIASLKKALCILSAYAQYGPDASEYSTCS